MKTKKLFHVLVMEGVLAAGLALPGVTLASEEADVAASGEEVLAEDATSAELSKKATRRAKRLARKARRAGDQTVAETVTPVEEDEEVTESGEAMGCGW